MLTRRSDIADAAAVDDALRLMVSAAASCRSPAPTCPCGLKQALGQLSATYHRAIAKHPGWNDPGTVVQYVHSASGRALTVAMDFPNLERQLGACNVR